MKAAAEAERQARLNAEYQAALERQRAEQQARLEQAKTDWETLLKNLPGELEKLEKVVLDLIPEWEQKASATINWDQIEDPACSTEWELRFNSYERLEENIYCQYESSDSRRGGYDTERVIREKMPGSYWVNPHSNKEYFVSRASHPQGEVPPVQYPYCTIAGELSLWKEYPHDKARVDAIIQKYEEDRAYYQNLINEARAALAGTTQERAKYLLSQREGDKVRNKLKQVWRILNPDKPESLFWDDILQAV
jgi:hypothetical protein